MSDIADKIYAATGLTLGAEEAAKIGQMIQVENEKLRAKQADRIAALEAAVTQCRTLSAMLKPQADRITELEAALRFYADDENWRHNGQLDPNSGNFTGGPARAALGEKE
jgi:hypothetical protein